MTAITITPDDTDPRQAITQQFAALLPYVIHLPRGGRCQGWRTATMTAEAAGDPVKREKYRCRNQGRWRFYPINRTDLVHAAEGDFCWSHLVMDCLNFSPAETRRMELALAELTRITPAEPRRARKTRTR